MTNPFTSYNAMYCITLASLIGLAVIISAITEAVRTMKGTPDEPR